MSAKWWPFCSGSYVITDVWKVGKPVRLLYVSGCQVVPFHMMNGSIYWYTVQTRNDSNGKLIHLMLWVWKLSESLEVDFWNLFVPLELGVCNFIEFINDSCWILHLIICVNIFDQLYKVELFLYISISVIWRNGCSFDYDPLLFPTVALHKLCALVLFMTMFIIAYKN